MQVLTSSYAVFMTCQYDGILCLQHAETSTQEVGEGTSLKHLSARPKCEVQRDNIFTVVQVVLKVGKEHGQAWPSGKGPFRGGGGVVCGLGLALTKKPTNNVKTKTNEQTALMWFFLSWVIYLMMCDDVTLR